MATRTRPHWGIVTTLAVAAALTACTGADPKQTGSSSSAPSSAPTTSTPVTTTSSSDPAAGATSAVTRWWTTFDRISQDSAVPISDLLKVSRGAAYQTWAQEAQRQRARGWRQIGETVIASSSATKIADVESRPAMSVQVCYDVSKVNMVDATGKSVISPDRIPRAKATYVVVKYDDGWFVVNDETRGVPC